MTASLLALPLLTAVVLCPSRVQAQSTGVLSGTLTDLYDFSGGSDGEYLFNGLVQGSDGNLYGTTANGGDASGHGTVYQITPAGVLTTLYRFTGGSDGANPYAGLVQGSDGNLYGTTVNDGANGFGGTVYRISHAGALTTLYSFTGGNDGAYPYGTLVQGSDGNFYGTTYGITSGDGTRSYGTVFEITPAGVLTTLASFTAGDGNQTSGSLTQGQDGNFYGVAAQGGAYSDGEVYQVTPAGAFTSLYSFTGGADGGAPAPALVLGGDGNFYGTTSEGGGSGVGTVYQITPAGVLTTLFTFTGGNDGSYPASNLILGPDGLLFGTTTAGGANGDGTVFEITPTAVLTTLFAFKDTDANLAESAPVLGSNGNFYFTTSGVGSIYQLVITSGLPGSSSVQLDAATDNVAENAGSITLSVDRTGGSMGAITVDYTTVDNSALAGTDYQATSGTLSWADGDATPKTITVPIIDRGLTEGSTSFLVNLSNATGGATLTSPAQGVVTILDTAASPNIRTVTLINPPAGVTILQNKSLSVRADVEALSGTLSNVEFYAIDSSDNSVDLGGTTNPRGSVTWQPTAADTYTLQVVATDIDGNTLQTTSPVTVAAPTDTALPQTSLDGNLDSTTVRLNTTLPVVAQAVDSAGNPLQNVQFYLDGVPVSSSPVTMSRPANRKAADATANSLFIANILASKIEQVMTAVGTTASGVSSVSTPVTIYGKADAGAPPTATISNLASGASVPTSAGQSVTVAATTGSQGIAKVQLVVDNQSVGTATAAPYTFTLPALGAGSHALSVIATDVGALSSVSTPVVVTAEQTATQTATFFTGEVALSNGVYYLSFPNGNYFGYYSFLPNPAYLYHFDLGFEYIFDAADGKSGVYFYDFASSTFFYTSPSFPFPYLYDFTLNSVLYYYPDPNNAGHYNTDGVRYFYDFNTGTIITK